MIPESALESAKILKSFTWAERGLLALGSAIAYFIVAFLAGLIHVPAEPGFSASLLQQPNPLLTLVVVLIGVVVTAALAVIITHHVRDEAPLFCAALGLISLSIRGGTMADVLFSASSPAVYLSLSLELVLLFGLLAVARLVIQRIAGVSPTAAGEAVPAANTAASSDEDMAGNGPFALLAATAVTSLLMLLLCRTDAKGQVLASLLICETIGALAASYCLPARSKAWVLLSPLAVGLLGYIAAYFQPNGWLTGQTGGGLSALARPLPIDYASVGVAAAFLGYWTGELWRQTPADEEETGESQTT